MQRLIMKIRIFTISLINFVCISLNAQTSSDCFHPMIQEGKLWKAVVPIDVEIMNAYYEEEHFIAGDTIINGKTWKKTFKRVNGFGQLESLQEDFYYFAAIREEGAKVYGVAKGLTTERLLYNFNLKVGDIIRCVCESQLWRKFAFILEPDENYNGWCTEMYLKSIDIIQIQGQNLRRFIFECNYSDKVKQRFAPSNNRAAMFPYPNIVWVEGIGSDGGPFTAWSKSTAESSLSCYLNGNIIFNWEDFYVDGMTDGIKENVKNEELKNERIYNYNGQRISLVQKGLNIVDGKKILMK